MAQVPISSVSCLKNQDLTGSQMPAVQLTDVTAPWPWVTQPCSAGGSRCAQAQGAVLGARTQSGFAHSQAAVALGRTLFSDGHQGWPVNLPSKENGEFPLN